MLRRLATTDFLCTVHPVGFNDGCEGCKALRRAELGFTALDDQRALVMAALVKALAAKTIVIAGVK
jgi:hypothetical protein